MDDRIGLFLDYLVENKGRSIATAKNYKSHLDRFHLYLSTTGRQAEEIEPMEIEAYTGPILHKGGLGARGRSSAISAIKGFYKFCFNRGLMTKNPSRDLDHPRHGRTLPEILSYREMEGLIFEPDLSTLAGLRDAAVLAFLFATGARVSGVTGLNEDQLVYGGEEKPPRLYVTLLEKGKKERKIPLNRKAEMFLFAYLNHQELAQIDRTVKGGTKVVFVNLRNRSVDPLEWRGEKRRMSMKAIAQILKKYGRRLNIPEQRLHVHTIRHTVATDLYDANMNLEDRMAWLGHSRADTMAIYPLLSKTKLLPGAESANPMSKLKTPIDELFKSIYGHTKVDKKL